MADEEPKQSTMATVLAAAAPIAQAVLPEIISLIAGLVHKAAPAAEAANGPATGPVKFADVFVQVMGNLVKAHAAGQIATLPDDPTVKIIIQTVVTSMKLLGALSPAAPDQSIAIKAGQTITITGG